MRGRVLRCPAPGVTAIRARSRRSNSAITSVNPNIAYDDFRHRLSYTGVFTPAQTDALKAVAGVTTLFQEALDALFARSEDAKGSLFARYPELQLVYDA